MRLHRAAPQLRSSHVTIGNFDGFHLGHQALFSALKQPEAKNASLGAVTFYPHPRRFFSGVSRLQICAHEDLQQLSTFGEKLNCFSREGCDFVYAIRFTREFSKLSPREFVQRHLVDALGVRRVVVGYDWSFGKGRVGSSETLAELGDEFGFEVEVVPPIEIDGIRAGTSAIKQALRRGDVETAGKLLGRPYSIIGRVRGGERRGRKLGFPTANLESLMQFYPRNGVYITSLVEGGESYPAVSNVGIRPTFGEDRRVVETHILDGQAHDLYRRRVEVRFLRRIRDEQHYGSVEELKAAIENDVREARQFFA